MEATNQLNILITPHLKMFIDNKNKEYLDNIQHTTIYEEQTFNKNINEIDLYKKDLNEGYSFYYRHFGCGIMLALDKIDYNY